jgi:hypothetical protein
MKHLLPLLIVAFSSAMAQAQTTRTWDGSSSTAWGTAANWTPSGVPAATDHVIIVNVTNDPVTSGNVTVANFTISSGSLDLNGYTLTANGNISMTGGVVSDGKIYKPSGGSATLNGANATCKLNITATSISVQNSVCGDSARFKLTSTAGTWKNNKFIGHLEVENASAASNLNMGNLAPDTMLAGLTIRGSRVRLGYFASGTYIQGDVHIHDAGATGTYTGFGSGDANGGVHVNGDIYVNKNSLGTLFFGSPGSMTMAPGKRILDGTTGYDGGPVWIYDLQQLGTGGGIELDEGAGTQTLTFNDSAQVGALTLTLKKVVMDGTIVKGDATMTVGDITLTDNRFKGNTQVTKNSTTNNFNGGNVFERSLHITNSSASDIHFAYTAPDTVQGDLHLRTTTAQNLVMGELDDLVAMGGVYCREEAGNIILSGTAYGGNFIFAGVGNQVFRPMEGNAPMARKITINKPSGQVLLTGELPMSQQLVLTSGVIRCLNGAFVSFADNATVSGANDLSFVEGPVNKTGNDAFSFPVGRGDIYQPLTITAPGTTGHIFQAEYFDYDSDPDYDHANREVSINYLDRTQYWMFNKLSGSAGVYVTIGWRDVACGIASITTPKICAWSTAGSGQWKNLGNTNAAGTVVTGSARTTKTSEYYGPYTWGNFSGISAQAGPDRVIASGDSAHLGIMDQPAWDYEWTPATYVLDDEDAITRAWPTVKTDYILEVTGENGCIAKDTMTVFITTMPESEGTSSLDFVVNNGQLIDTEGAPRADIGIYSHNASPMLYCAENALSFVQSKIDTLSRNTRHPCPCGHPFPRNASGCPTLGHGPQFASLQLLLGPLSRRYNSNAII